MRHVLRPRSRVPQRKPAGLADFCAPGAGSAELETGHPAGQLNETGLVLDDCVVKNMTCDTVGQCKQRKLAEDGTCR